MAAHVEQTSGHQNHHQHQRENDQEVADAHHGSLEMRNTSSARASICCQLPLRSARAFRASELFNASSALDASCSSQNPSSALNNSSDVMMVKSPQSPTMKAINAAASIIHGMGPQKYTSKAANAFFCFSTSAFGP